MAPKATGSEVALSASIANYPALTSDPGKALAVLQENMGGEKLTEFDLERVKIPSGGGAFWEVPGMEGPEARKVLEGVVVLTKNVRAYWPLALEEGGGNDPPQCTSPDGIQGHGDPGVLCESCAFAQFGSARDGRGQACKQMRQLFLLTESSVLPLVLTLPPTSLGAARKYFMRLASGQQLYYWQVITKVALEDTKNAGGQSYSRATFTAGERLTEADAIAVGKYKDALEPILSARLPTQQEAAGA